MAETGAVYRGYWFFGFVVPDGDGAVGAGCVVAGR